MKAPKISKYLLPALTVAACEATYLRIGQHLATEKSLALAATTALATVALLQMRDWSAKRALRARVARHTDNPQAKDAVLDQI